jgi:hypothetical protein
VSNIPSAMRDAAKDNFWALRAHAIQAYARLEQSLCILLSCLGDMRPQVAAIIFFKITSSRARDSVLEKLIKKKHGSLYSTFWKSAFKHLGQLSEKRNQIVHWNAKVVVHKNIGFHRVQLEPPNFWEYSADTPVLTSTDLFDFIRRCEFVAPLCSMFHASINPNPVYIGVRNEDQEKAWRDIYQKELVYPPPNTHPLYQNHAESGNQPPTSEVLVIPGDFREVDP